MSKRKLENTFGFTYDILVTILLHFLSPLDLMVLTYVSKPLAHHITNEFLFNSPCSLLRIMFLVQCKKCGNRNYNHQCIASPTTTTQCVNSVRRFDKFPVKCLSSIAQPNLCYFTGLSCHIKGFSLYYKENHPLTVKISLYGAVYIDWLHENGNTLVSDLNLDVTPEMNIFYPNPHEDEDSWYQTDILQGYKFYLSSSSSSDNDKNENNNVKKFNVFEELCKDYIRIGLS